MVEALKDRPTRPHSDLVVTAKRITVRTARLNGYASTMSKSPSSTLTASWPVRRAMSRAPQVPDHGEGPHRRRQRRQDAGEVFLLIRRAIP